MSNVDNSSGRSDSTVEGKDELAEILDREFDHSFYVKELGVRDEGFSPFFDSSL